MTPSPKKTALTPRYTPPPGEMPFELGAVIPTAQRFELSWDQLAVHMAVLGGSGSGKSKFLELLMRQMMVDGRGFCYIDPHGDTAKDLLAFAAAKKADGDDTLWRRVHYLHISTEAAVSFDPFARAPLRGEVSRLEYYSWLRTKVNRVCRSLLRRVSEADLDTMNRLKKWLKCILYACGVAIDDRNTHLGLDKMLVFTDPQDDDFPALLDTVWEFLPRWVQNNFRRLRQAKNEQIRDKLESSVNRLVDILSELMEEVFSQRAPSLDVGQIIAESGFLIVDMGETIHWDFDQKVTFGGLIIDEVLLYKQAEENLPREQRVPFALIIDESGEFLGEDLQRALGATRKFELPIILAAQDLSTFAKGDFDMAPKVLSMCQTVVCFQQTYRKDKEILADRLGAGNLDFTERLQEVQRQRGWLERQLEEHSYGNSQSHTWNRSNSESRTDSANEVISEMLSVMRGHARMRGNSLSRSRSDARGGSQGSGSSLTHGVSPIIVHGELVGLVPTVSKGHQVNRSDSRSSVEGTTAAENTADTATEAETQGEGRAVGHGRSDMTGRSIGKGGANALSHTVAYKTTILPNLVSEMERTGQLDAGTITEQFERMMQQLHTLSVAEAIVCPRHEKFSFPVQIARVEEWWATGEDKRTAIARIIEGLRALRPYYFRPGEQATTAHPQTPASESSAAPHRRLKGFGPEIVTGENSFED